MSVMIIYTIECHCGADATSTSLDLSNPQPDGTVRIDVEMSIGQEDFECPRCGCFYGTGDIDYEKIDDDCTATEDGAS